MTVGEVHIACKAESRWLKISKVAAAIVTLIVAVVLVSYDILSFVNV